METLRKTIALLRRESKLALFIRIIPKEIGNLPFPMRFQPGYACSDDHFRNSEYTLFRPLEEIAAEAEKLMSEIDVGHGSPPMDFMKLNAAMAAYHLMCKLDIRPTLTDQGQYYRLAAIFYEGATGIADADLSRSCRLLFHNENLRN
jgi:hypothetical protein